MGPSCWILLCDGASSPVFAKLKHLLREAQERSREATWRRIGELLERFTPDECANYLANSGYASTTA